MLRKHNQSTACSDIGKECKTLKTWKSHYFMQIVCNCMQNGVLAIFAFPVKKTWNTIFRCSGISASWTKWLESNVGRNLIFTKIHRFDANLAIIVILMQRAYFRKISLIIAELRSASLSSLKKCRQLNIVNACILHAHALDEHCIS